METAYTIGRTISYDADLKKHQELGEPMYKIGVRDDYGGGWVWRLAADADNFRRSDLFQKYFPDAQNFSVYRLELPTSWDVDTYHTLDADCTHHLKNDARIVARVSLLA